MLNAPTIIQFYTNFLNRGFKNHFTVHNLLKYNNEKIIKIHDWSLEIFHFM